MYLQLLKMSVPGVDTYKEYSIEYTILIHNVCNYLNIFLNYQLKYYIVLVYVLLKQ